MKSRRLHSPTILLLISSLLCLSLAEARPQLSERSDSGPRGVLRREGSNVSHVSGQIVKSGQRWSFATTNERSFRLLENLTLQRIVRSLKTDRTDRYWTVEGTFTEFGGENFLLLSGAVRATKPPSKQSVSQDTISSPDRSETE